MQPNTQEIQSHDSDKPDPYQSVVTQWLEADHHKFTEAVIRALMAGRTETA